MRITGGIEEENDKLVQIWASKQRSYISNKTQNIVGHHYYSRRNKLLRWDLHNIIPLTYEEHTDFHAGKFLIEIKNPFRKQYLENLINVQYKDYLLEHNLTDREFVKQCNDKLKEIINEL